MIAVGFAMVLRGRGGDVISRAAGSGVLDEGAEVAKAQLSQEIEQGKVVPPGIADTDPQPGGPSPATANRRASWLPARVTDGRLDTAAAGGKR